MLPERQHVKYRSTPFSIHNWRRLLLTCNVQRDGDKLQGLLLRLVGDAGQRHVVVTKRRRECQFVDSIDQTTKPVGLRVVPTKIYVLVG